MYLSIDDEVGEARFPINVNARSGGPGFTAQQHRDEFIEFHLKMDVPRFFSFLKENTLKGG